MKLPTVYEELAAIMVIDLEAEACYIASKDPLEHVLVEHYNYGDPEAHEMVKNLDMLIVGTLRDHWDPLNMVLGPLPKNSIE